MKILLLSLTVILLSLYACAPSVTPQPTAQPTQPTQATQATVKPTAQPTQPAQATAKPTTPQPTVKSSPVATASPQSEWDRLVADAKKEGSVSIYAGPVGAARQAMMDAFRQKYGISLDIVMARGSEVLARIDSERKANLFVVDMAIWGMGTYFTLVKPMGITVPIEPLLVLPEVRDLSKWRQGKIPMGDKEGHLAVLSIGPAPLMAVNTDMVKRGDITTHSSLLGQKWRGKIVINDPSVSGSGNEWFTFVVTELMGVEKGTAFMGQLAKQEPALTRDQRLQTEWVARGKHAVALGPDQALTVDFIRAGAPLAFAELEEPGPADSGVGNFSVLDKAPHPNAMKLFANWLMSKEGAEVYSRASGYASLRSDVSTEWIDPLMVPRPNADFLSEKYHLGKAPMAKLAAEIFRDLMK